ncbi:MAG TPA: LysR family transcriptional regulator [Steroidobacteraceae bacterium]|nr:LysR family transcriptional regulator [Steroidobacteraceae bacterium]
MDLNEIRMFVQVARAGSFAAAARRLGVPSNTLSRRVGQLEARIKTRLLHRSTRKLSLTTAGRAFFERCVPAIDGLLAAAQELEGHGRAPQGRIRIAAPAGFFDLFRLDWIAEFLRAHPRVRVEFLLDDARNDLIADGIDVAFRAGPTAGAGALVLRTLWSESFRLYASPAYLAARGAPATLRDLADHDCVTVSQHAGRTVWVLEGPAGPEEIAVAGRFGANNVQALRQAALADLGIAQLPTALASADVAAARLIEVLPRYRREGADLQVVVVPGLAQIPPAVRAFIDFAERKLRGPHGSAQG